VFQPTYPIRTARLTLRPVTLDDVDDVYAYQRRPDVVRWMLGAEPRTREQSRASVVAMAGEDALRAEGDCLTLAVVTDAGMIGTVELVWRSRLDRMAELGYVFHPDHGVAGWLRKPLRLSWLGVQRVGAAPDLRSVSRPE
jgi:RimJ/RimL family protein N-acetyltransferase